MGLALRPAARNRASASPTGGRRVRSNKRRVRRVDAEIDRPGHNAAVGNLPRREAAENGVEAVFAAPEAVVA